MSQRQLDPRQVDATGLPDGKVMTTLSEQWVAGDLPEGGSGGSFQVLELGKTTPGGTMEVTPALQVMKKITVPSGGAYLEAVGAYIRNAADSVSEFGVGLMSDVAGTPGPMIACSPIVNNGIYMSTTPRWMMVPLGMWLAAGDYWIVWNSGPVGGVGANMYYDEGGSDRVQNAGANPWMSDYGMYTPSTSSRTYSVKAQLLKPSEGTVEATEVLETIGVALSDETTAITTGTAKATIRMPFAMTLTAVRASLSTASSSGIPTVDINENGTTILSTKLTIDASEKTSVTAATSPVISDPSLNDDAEITFDIDVAGTGAKGLKVWLIGYRT